MVKSIPPENSTNPWTLSAFADEAGTSIAAQIEALRRAGIKHIDLRNVDGHNITELPLGRAEQVRGKLDDAGITMSQFGSPIGKIDVADDFEPDLRRLEHLGKLSNVLGGRSVRIFSYYNRQNAPVDQWQQRSLQRLRRLREHADKLRLVLFHENERGIFGDRCAQIQVLADELRDGERFKLIFDFDNYNQSGDDVWHNWLNLRDVTDAFHLKDSDDQNQHVPVGQGTGRVGEILTDAWQRAWEGPLSLEPHLTHSGAVALTGPHGDANRAFTGLSPAECFHTAAETAMALMDKIGARVD